MAEHRRTRYIPEAISIQLAATILDISPMTVRRMIKRGALKAVRIGPVLIRIPRNEIARLRASVISPEKDIQG